MNGFLNLHKPLNISSAKAVTIVKKKLNVKKIGHAGTLDPLASGVLPLAINEATKVISYLVNDIKEYKFTICWGEDRDTMDAEGVVVNRNNKVPSKQEILRILPRFVGNIEQVPPIYSAISVNGRRAYQMARQGKVVEMPSRKITIQKLSLLHCDNQQASFATICGKGTYIRSLAQDIAHALKCCGYVSNLCRTAVGSFNIDDAILLDDVQVSHLRPIEEPIAHLPGYQLDQQQYIAIKNGQKLILNNLPFKEGDIIKCELGNKLVAFARCSANYLKPIRVFNN